MKHNSRIVPVVLRTVVILAFVAACIYLSALLGSSMALRQMAAVLRRQAAPAGPQPLVVPEDAVVVAFYQATGIEPPELEEYLDAARTRQAQDAPPVAVKLQNDRGDYLAEGKVVVRWNGGERAVDIGRSGVLYLPLRRDMLPGLKIIVPAGYTKLTQMSIPLGTAYVAETKLDAAELEYPIVSDREIEMRLRHGVASMLQEGDVLSAEDLGRQLRRATTDVQLPAPNNSAVEMTLAEVYRRRRESVVVIGHLFARGNVMHSGGVVVHGDGVIATAYHVINKPTARARAVMTWAGDTYAVREVLAADQANDVALIKIDAKGLTAAPVSRGDGVGGAIAVIAHPGGHHFMLTEGRIARYTSAESYGRTAIDMAVTADFADGGSGSPVFNSRGEVAGIVSSTHALGAQMVIRMAAPAIAIRGLLGEPLPRAVPLGLVE